ncbi:MAG: hypothetical protein Q4D98_02195 [Planctomycetia bacterium]|nr:hypothetical protein [Planctomycetia bacterium]
MKRFLFLLLILTAAGCHNYSRNVLAVRSDFYQNNLERASEGLAKEKVKKANAKSRDVMKLEEAMMLMCRGEFKRSETLLREVRDQFDLLDAKRGQKGAEKAVSMLTDDCSVSYPGEDYEKVMIRAMLALTSVMTDGQDAKAYANQIHQKQQEIIAQSETNPETNERVKDSYRRVALGPYLCGVIDQTSMLDQNETIRQFEKVCQWAPDFMPGKILLEHAKTVNHSKKGDGVVQVFIMLGRGPYKVQTNAPVTQLSLLLTDQIVSAVSKHSVPPTLAPVPIPEVVMSPCRYTNVDVQINGKLASRTDTITDINRMAFEQFEVNRPWIIARAAARRLVKKAGIYGFKEAVKTDSPEGELLLDIVGILWEATEEADTRCWSLLPGRIQVARIELPAGEYTLGLQAVAGNMGFDRSQVYTKPVRVVDGQNTYVFAYLADEGLLGQIQVNPR